jgi:von Willebrand factor type A domain
MNTDYTEILFILDRSGSMQPLMEATITSFNQFMESQSMVPGKVRFSLLLFDDQLESPYKSAPLNEIPRMTTRLYQPRGSTALLDAMGTGITSLGARLAAMPERERPCSVLVAILTDGEENCSIQYSWKKIASMIRHQTNHYSWHFLFLGANQDAIATASRLNIPMEHSATWQGDSGGVSAANATLSRKASALRKAATGQSLTQYEQADLVAPLHEIVREEQARSRSI